MPVFSKRKYKKGETIPKQALREMFFQKKFRRIPVTALCEILTWEYVHKSPYSESFYNKKKDWDITIHSTIRISDHWNFFTGEKIHCKTSTDVEPEKWYAGIYDESTQTYDITKCYEPSSQSEIDEFYDKIKKDHKEYFVKGEGASIVAFGRALHDSISNSNAYFISDDGKVSLITRWKMTSHKSPNLTIVENGQKVKIKGKPLITGKVPFHVMFDGVTMDGKTLMSNLRT